MRNVNASAFVRVPFLVVLEDLPALDLFTLRMKYDDGFAAYLNGVKVTEANAPASLSWNSAATAEHADIAALQFATFDLAPYAGLLQDGINVLAIHGLNRTADDDDFHIVAVGSQHAVTHADCPQRSVRIDMLAEHGVAAVNRSLLDEPMGA